MLIQFINQNHKKKNEKNDSEALIPSVKVWLVIT